MEQLRYEITYIATNVSDSTLYIKGQDERWEDSGWTPSGAYGPGESFKESDNFVDEDVYKTNFVSFLYSNVILAETDYYRIELRSMTGEQGEDGKWKIDVEIVVYNACDSRYLLFDPGKQAIEGYSWDGVVATRLFDFTLTATLRLSKTAPVVH